MENKKQIWLKVMLIVSLCFNMLFLNGYAVLNMLKTSKGRVALTARILKLSNLQKEELSALSIAIQGYRKDMWKSQTGEINELCDELSKNNPNYERIDQLMDILVEARSKFLVFSSEQTKPFLKDLTLKQRLGIVKKIRKTQTTIMSQ